MIKRLAGCVRQYKLPSILAPLFVSGEVILEVIIPVVLAKLIDNGVNGSDMGAIIKYGAILVALSVVSLACGALSGNFAAVAASGFGANLRHDIYYNIQNFSFGNIDKYSTASLITRLTTDVTNIQNAYQMIIRVAVRSPVMLVFSLIMVAKIAPKLSLILLAVVPVLAIGLWLIMSHAHPVFERVFKTYDKLNRVVQENLRGVRVVKAFVREQHEVEKFNDVSQSIYSDFSKAEKLIALNSPLMQFCVYFCMLAISYFGSVMVVNGELSTGLLFSLFTYLMQVLMSLMMFSLVFVMVTISRASAERIDEVLCEQSTITNGENPVYKIPNGSISFKNVGFSYKGNKKHLCLSDVNLEIKSGETVGIIGSTGSSKSTLVQLIPRLYDVTCGELCVGGINVKNYDLEALRDSVAMVLQKNVLFSGTIKENLRWGNAEATDEQLENACKLACADGFIKEFPDGYDTYIEQGGSNVSGGQKQRLCIARALLKNPKILILDDSTSAVDTATDASIRKAFYEQIPETTKIIIAQRINSVMDADKIIVMDGGKINAVGTHEQLLKTNKIYYEVYTSQQKGAQQDE